MNPTEHLLSAKDVTRRTSLSRNTLDRYAAQGLFPKPVQIGPKRVAWSARAVDAWIAEKLASA